MAYGARLESAFPRKGIEGSNPSPSAKYVVERFIARYNEVSSERSERSLGSHKCLHYSCYGR